MPYAAEATPVLSTRPAVAPRIADATLSAATIGTTETVLTTFTVPADTLKASRAIRADLRGRVTRSAAGPTLRLRLRWGGVTGVILADTGAMLCPVGGITDIAWFLDALITCRSAGGSGTVFPEVILSDFNSASALSNKTANPTAAGSGATATTAAVTVDTTTQKALVLTVEYSAGTAGNTITVAEEIWELLTL